MKRLLAVSLVLLFGLTACGDPSPTAPAIASTTAAPPSPTSAMSASQPRTPMRDVLLTREDLMYPPQRWTQTEDDGGNRWSAGLCGKPSGPEPVARLARRFVDDAPTVTRVISSEGFLTEVVLVFGPGDADAFMAALPVSAEACRSELGPSGHELFGGEKQFPRIRHDALVYNLEAFSCCATPTGREADPHEIVFIRDADVVLYLYGTANLEPAARHAEDRLDGLPPSKD